MGITALKDGVIVASSKYGVMMAARVDLNGEFVLIDALELSKYAKASPCVISNSISSEGQGVYVVTQRELARVDFDSTVGKFVFRWSTVYGQTEEWMVARLGPGSGSTPTVTECGGKTMVVITDGALPMNLMYFDAEDGKLIGSKKVQFGADESGNLPTTSEQSVAVDQCKAFVVQNYMGIHRLDDNVRCSSIPPKRKMLRRYLAEFCAAQRLPGSNDLFSAKACPVVFGCSSDGAAVYEIEPTMIQSGGE